MGGVSSEAKPSNFANFLGLRTPSPPEGGVRSSDLFQTQAITLRLVKVTNTLNG